MKRLGIPEKELEEAVDVLRGGGLIIHPTETVYGIAAVWNNEQALRKAAALKQRSLTKPFSILVSRVNEMIQISGWKDGRLRELLESVFPAPLTILLPRQRTLPLSFWNQFPEIGFRLSEFALCQVLVERVGEPLITTSANIAGQSPPKTAAEVDPLLIAGADLFLDAGDCPLKIPSTVLRFDPNTGKVDVLREGAFAARSFQEQVRELYR